MPTRVVINGRFLQQSATGVQRYAQETVLALDDLLVQEHGPESGSPWAHTRFELAVPHCDDAPARPLPKALQRIQRVELPLLARSGHLWEQITLGWHARGAALLGLSYSGPVLHGNQVVTIHDAAVRAWPGTYSRSYRWVHDTLVGILKHRARTVMTVSQFSRQELIDRYGVKPSKIVVGHEGWQHAVSDAPPEYVRERFGLEPGRYLLCVGSLKPSKNLEVVARAMAQLGDLDLPLAIAGAADPRLFGEASQLRKMVQSDGRVRLLGFVNDEDLFALYRHAKLFVIPSLYEGFGLPAIEALANGCALVASRAASLPEVLGDAAVWFAGEDQVSLATAVRTGITAAERRVAIPNKTLLRHSWPKSASVVLASLGRATPTVSTGLIYGQ